MTPEMVMSVAYQGMRVTLFLAGPMLLAALFTGQYASPFSSSWEGLHQGTAFLCIGKLCY